MSVLSPTRWRFGLASIKSERCEGLFSRVLYLSRVKDSDPRFNVWEWQFGLVDSLLLLLGGEVLSLCFGLIGEG